VEAWLIAMGGSLSGAVPPRTQFPLPAGRPLLVGRSPDADVLLSDLQVSRRHFLARHGGCGLWVRDLGSTNGTRVNDTAAIPGTDLLACNGNAIWAGSLSFRLVARAVLDPRWLGANGGVARRLIRRAREDGDAAVLPVLADALEEAGCADAELLGHLRWGGEHALGCWALGLLYVEERSHEAPWQGAVAGGAGGGRAGARPGGPGRLRPPELPLLGGPLPRPAD
jgi:hypothetical protein